MSKKSNNPFVSISDLMASVTAIVILLLVVSIVKSEIQQRKAAEEKAKAEQEKIKGVNAAIIGIKNALQNDSLIQINTFEHTIILQDASFKSGSACLSSEVGALLDSIVAPQIISTLRNASYGNVRVQIEGHTDPVPVGRMSISEVSLKEKCALFDDNYTLSAGRARQARNRLLMVPEIESDSTIGKKISVVGFGPDRLVDTVDVKSPKNRRVEIRLLTDAM